MKVIKISADILECEKSELSAEDFNLVKSSENFLKNSYAPYSKFSVSAAVLLDNGVIVNGTNQENAASPSGTCAERTAIFYANSQYPKNKILAVAISAFFNGEIISTPIPPCGSCRQVILETETRFSSPVKLILSAKNKCLIINSIKDILPLTFTSDFLS